MHHIYSYQSYFMGENFFLVGNTGDDVIRPRPRSRDLFRRNLKAP